MENLKTLLKELQWLLELQREDVYDSMYWISEEIQYVKMDIAELCPSQDCLTCPCKEVCPF